jgi:hypothetical protein
MENLVEVEALSGTEIIDDILAQIKRKLQYSCDLRSTDAYGQGYSATIDIHLKLYSVDTVSLDMTVNMEAKGEPPVSTEEVIVTPLEVSEKVEIPQELDIELIRERLKDAEVEPPPPPSEIEEARMPERMKRKYTRRLVSEQPAEGVAVEMDQKF